MRFVCARNSGISLARMVVFSASKPLCFSTVNDVLGIDSRCCGDGYGACISDLSGSLCGADGVLRICRFCEFLASFEGQLKPDSSFG
jgi:hypothetical protein